MSVREGAAGGVGSEAGERRGNAGQRVHFEALVAMAETSGGSGFEAESVDVSPEGMRLRTAYLPQIGEKLVCRFESGGSEMVVEGEVIWRNEAARGGEFGIRFTDLDREMAESLRSMCTPAEIPGGSSGAAGGSGGSVRGTRVRLHIEGLGSPMKARVRESVTGEVLVGSNLEFLRVGRTLELEDVDHGIRREAHIDNVKVEIDPGTNIPQLVVALRYDDGDKKAQGAAGAPGKTGKTGLLAKAKAAAASIAASGGSSDASASANASASNGEAPRGRVSRSEGRDAPRKSAAPPDRAVSADGFDDDGDGDGDDDSGADERKRGEKLKSLGTKAANAGKAVADKVGPSLAAVSAKTKGAMAGLIAALQRKRAERAERAESQASQKDASPRRMTAPPPTGALRSEGRKLVRDENEEGEEELTPEPPRANKRAAVIGSAVGLLAVLAIFGLTRVMGLHRSSDSAAVDAQGTPVLALPSASPSGSPNMPAAAPASGTLMADVPLFGATPLSTMEPVPGMAPPSASALTAAGAPGMPGAPGALDDPNAAAAPGAGSADLAANDPGDSGGLDDDSENGNGGAKKEWGTGGVRNPIVLRLKMDGAIEKLNGAAGAMGFTISLPDRRSVSAASELARKDKRIASLQVVNRAHGAEVTVQFKDGVPPYLAKAKGDRLEIALGTEGHKKVAAKGGHSKKKSATANAKKKGAAGKQADKKKKKPANN